MYNFNIKKFFFTLSLLVFSLQVSAQTTFADEISTANNNESSGTAAWTTSWTGSPSLPNTRAERNTTSGEWRLRQNNTQIQRNINLDNYDLATLTIAVRTTGNLSSSDQLRLEFFNGSSWTTLRTWNGNTLTTSYEEFSYNIGSLTNTNSSIRITVSSTNTAGRYFGIDYIRIEGTQPSCFSDNFTSNLSANWTTSSVSGSFGNPTIQNGRLRLTNATQNVSTAASLLRIFPGANNKIVVEFDYLGYGGNGADGIAITLSDSNVNPVPGGFGGSLGYAQRSGINGFAGGWLGVGIDEFGNYSNPTEGRSGGPGSRVDAVALRGSGSGQTGYNYLRGTNTLSPGIDISGNTPGPNHRYRITVDHRSGIASGAQISVERNTGSGWVSIIAPFDIFVQNPSQVAVPESFRLSITASTGGNTNIHEIDNFSVCATKVNNIVEIDHFRFNHDGQGLTCSSENITIQACLNSDCSQTYNGPITATLLPSSGWPSNPITFNSGDTVPLTNRTPSTVTLGVSSSSVPRKPFIPDRCYVAGIQQTNCNLSFVDAGLDYNIPNHISGNNQSVTIRAVQRDNITNRCIPLFSNANRTIRFTNQYQNPSTGTIAPTINNTNITTTGTNIPLSFNANGESTFTFQYRDVGAIRINASYTGQTSSGDNGLNMTNIGQDDTIVRPSRLVPSVADNPSATSANGGVFKKAGENFPIQVASYNSLNQITPNFGRESTPERPRLNNQLVLPVGGNNPSMNGTWTNVSGGIWFGNWSWREVGIISLSTPLEDNNYLGSGSVPSDTISHLGRFIPQRLLFSFNSPTFRYGCAAGLYSYWGEPLNYQTKPEITVTGVSSTGLTTLNYDQDFMKWNGNLSSRNYIDTSTASAVTTLNFITNGGNGVLSGNTSGYNGQATSTISYDVLQYTKPSQPHAPFIPSIRMNIPAIDLTDSDGVCFTNGLNDTCLSSSINNITSETNHQHRWGRLNIGNVAGSEITPMIVPVFTEYYDGNLFITNEQDACTIIQNGFIALNISNTDSIQPNDVCIRDIGTPGNSGIGCPTNYPNRYNITPWNGKYNVIINPPGQGKTGQIDLQGEVPDWLYFNWNNNGMEKPKGRIGFGVYSSDPRQIYKREVH